MQKKQTLAAITLVVLVLVVGVQTYWILHTGRPAVKQLETQMQTVNSRIDAVKNNAHKYDSAFSNRLTAVEKEFSDSGFAGIVIKANNTMLANIQKLDKADSAKTKEIKKIQQQIRKNNLLTLLDSCASNGTGSPDLKAQVANLTQRMTATESKVEKQETAMQQLTRQLDEVKAYADKNFKGKPSNPKKGKPDNKVPDPSKF